MTEALNVFSIYCQENECFVYRGKTLSAHSQKNLAVTTSSQTLQSVVDLGFQHILPPFPTFSGLFFYLNYI